MNYKTFLKIITVLLVTFFAVQTFAGETVQTKFISGNPQFEPDQDIEGAFIYKKPGVDGSKYSKVLIDPIEIFIADDSEYKGLDPDKLKAITDSLRHALTKELEPDYPVVNEPGVGVLGIRLAITDVHLEDKKRGLLGYTPIGLVLTTAGNLAGARTELSKAHIEVEILDGQTNEQLAALIDPFTSLEKGKHLSWEKVEKQLEYYSKRLRTRLEQD